MTPRLRTGAAWTLIALSITGLLAVATGGTATAALSDGGATSTAVTVSGAGEFSGVNVTVAQTQDLVNQVVRVSWTGAQPTAPASGSFSNNFMQVMQCWGDGPKPLRQNCQFGAYQGDPRGGNAVASRQVNNGVNLVDPEETIVPTKPNQNVSVPFTSVHGDSTTAFPNPYFDTNTTNEEPFGRTSHDGTGQVFFEIETDAQSPGLGCGAPEADGSPRACWIVVVPRGTHEVNGTQPQQLISSPLSQSNWDHAIAIRIHFRPLAATCPIGAAERRLIGQEEITEAISSWQSVLCQKTGSIFGFSQVSDDIARAQTLTSDPWMSMVTSPLDPARVTDGRKLTYAPITLDGVGIAFNIDQLPKYGAPPAALALAGQRLRSLRLNARLVAKLLTQSYRQASFSKSFPLHNPDDLTRDPEFQALNPGLNSMFFNGIYQIIVPEGLSDAYRELWRWVASDQSARAFLAGAPDEWGMTINPAYKGMDATVSTFPRLDLTCRPIGGGVGPECPFDKLAFAQDLHAATRAASRGDLLSRTYWDLTSQPPIYKDGPLQLSGSRAILALTETASAARYNLPMAELKNADGQFVAPTADSLTHGLDAMIPTGVGGTLASDPGSFDPAAYPLTHLTYAMTAPDRLSKTEATAYSRFLRYAVGAGQVAGISAGDLPPGYVPLPSALRTQTLAVADQVAAGTPPVSGGSTGSPTPTGSGGAGTTPTTTTTGPPSAPGGANVVTSPPATGKTNPVAAPQLHTDAYTTPKDDLGNARFILVAALWFGLAAGVAWLGIPLMARRGPPAT